MHRGIREHEAAAAEEHLVEGFHQRGVQGHLGGQHAHVLDAVARAEPVPPGQSASAASANSISSTKLSCGLGDVVRPLPVAEELDALDEAVSVKGAGKDLAAASIGVPHPEGDFHALGVQKIHAAGQRDSGHSAGGGWG